MRTVSLIASVVCLATALTQGQDHIVPAGTLLRCTLDEPELSSKTVNRGDPVLCHLDSVDLFGAPAFPNGAYLGGQFNDFRSPGHFYGKGWINLTFDRVVLPDESVTISARLVGASRYKVDRRGDILGRGHPQRDLVGWMLPPLWPVKIVTLPMRGPHPTLRGETSLTFRLLQDLAVPAPPLRLGETGVPRLGVDVFSPGEGDASVGGQLSPAFQEASPSPEWADPVEGRSTVLALKDGRAFVVTDYWVDKVGRLRLTMAGGTSRFLPVSSIDLETTVRVNGQRGLRFILKSEPSESSQ